MPSVSAQSLGALRSGWSATVDDCAISGGWTSDGEEFVVADAAGGVTVFDGKRGDLKWAKKQVHKGGSLATSVHPSEKKFATTGQDGQLIIWNAAETEKEQVIDIGKGWVENVSWSPDGNFVATSLSKTVYVYSAKGEEVWRTSDHQSTVSTISWSNAGELATACYGQVQFLDGTNGNVIQKLEWKGSLVSIALSNDSDVVACGSQDNSVHFWRRSTGKDSKMSGYPFKPSALAFNSEGSYLATGGSEAVTVWNFEGDGPEGTSPLELDYHPDAITSLLFSNNGNRLISGCRNGMVVLWEVSPNINNAKLGVGQAADTIAELHWRHDDRAIAALDRQGGVNVWRI